MILSNVTAQDRRGAWRTGHGPVDDLISPVPTDGVLPTVHPDTLAADDGAIRAPGLASGGTSGRT